MRLYFTKARLAEDKRRAILLTAVGPSTYGLIDSVDHPPPDLTFNKAHEVALAAEAAEKDSKRLMVSAHGDKDHAIPVGLYRLMRVGGRATATAPVDPRSRRTPENNRTITTALASIVPGVGGGTSQPTALTRIMSATTAKRKAIWPRCVGRRVDQESRRHTMSPRKSLPPRRR